MEIASILTLLNQEIGLSASSIGTSIIERAIRLRMEACRCASEAEYVVQLHNNKEEVRQLIDAVVIPETSFFRDNAPFKALSDYVKGEWLSEHKGEVLRVLSIPCATGEEPYSIAMVMLDNGLAESQFHIDAVDISERVLQIGRKGIYTDYSFRGTDKSYRDRYFTPEGEHYRLDDRVRRTVNFMRGNILDSAFVAARHRYHVIFCRNLLIYFDLANKLKAIEGLNSVLHDGGVLIMGHAETSYVPLDKYEKLSVPMAFGFRKLSGPEMIPRLTQMPNHVPALTSRFTPHDFKKALAEQFAKRSMPSSNGVVAPDQNPGVKEDVGENAGVQISDYALFMEQVAAGNFAAAVELGEPLVEAHELDAVLLYALGEAYRNSGNDMGAEECYRKVIYLDPDHTSALEQLGALAEKRYDGAAADKYRDRAARIKKRTIAPQESLGEQK